MAFSIAKRYSILLLILYCLALGPVLVIWGHLTYLPLPYLFLYLLPGFQAIRVASRFVILMLVAVSLLAAFGYNRLLATITRDNLKRTGIHTLLTVIVLTAMSVEFFLQEKKYNKDNGKENVPTVYTWLKNHSNLGAIAILPQQQGDLTKYDTRYGDKRVLYKSREFEYMYYSIFAGFPPMVNGAGGFIPPEYFKIRNAINNLTDAKNKNKLQALGIKTFVIHFDRFEAEDWQRWDRNELQKAGLKEIVRFKNDAVYSW